MARDRGVSDTRTGKKNQSFLYLDCCFRITLMEINPVRFLFLSILIYFYLSFISSLFFFFFSFHHPIAFLSVFFLFFLFSLQFIHLFLFLFYRFLVFFSFRFSCYSLLSSFFSLSICFLLHFSHFPFLLFLHPTSFLFLFLSLYSICLSSSILLFSDHFLLSFLVGRLLVFFFFLFPWGVSSLASHNFRSLHGHYSNYLS